MKLSSLKQSSLPLVLAALFSLSGCAKEPALQKDKALGTPVSEYCANKSLREEIISTADYYAIKDSQFGENDLERLNLCMSYKALTDTNRKLNVGAVYEKCIKEKALNNQSYHQYPDLMPFVDGFSRNDASFIPLTDFIKSRLKKPESFNHIKTVTNWDLNDKLHRYIALVSCTFEAEDNSGRLIRKRMDVSVDMISLKMRLIRVN
ncbi:MAG: hypothetical protein ACI4UM_05960 [Succinivibrio sp.]